MKFKIIYEYVYDVSAEQALEHYGTTDPQEMLAIDVENYNQNPYDLLDFDLSLKIYGEIVD